VPFVVGSLALLAYIYWPATFHEISFPAAGNGDTHIVVLAHGLKDSPDSWSDPLKDIIGNLDQETRVISLDWNPYSQNTFRCSVYGKRIGEKIGRHLAADLSLKSAHLIGHSCGSFVVLGLCQALKEGRDNVVVQTTFLDPVTVYGGIFWEYGLRRFGRCGDFSEAYIDTGDDVPGSNQLLPQAYTFDVTAVRELSDFSGSPHIWPTVYYLDLVRSGKALDLRNDKTLTLRYPQGVLEQVK
jgi:pimeloyl-ACP methyl ester carboxylesterase